MPSRTLGFVVAGVWYLLDQISKVWAERTLDEPLSIIPGFLRFEVDYNTGTMFSLFADWSHPWRALLLIILPLVVVPSIAWFLWRVPREEVLGRWGLSLLLGGALGNLTDRIVRGEVVDFIVCYAGSEQLSRTLIDWFGTNRWPTFNVADIGLFVGVVLIGAELLIRRRPASAPSDSDDAPESA